jgi:nucleotide-binding universal stress UspA family protein
MAPAPTKMEAPQTYQVLLAHDLTAHSEIALVRAARLTLERDGHLTVLHVIDKHAAPGAVPAQHARAEWHLENEIQRWTAHDKPSYRIRVALGDPATTVSAYAQGRRVDLVVAGRHRRHALTHLFVSTTVERFLQQIHAPLLVVNNCNQAPYRRVLIPIDFSEAAAPALRLAADFVPPHASVHLFHVAVPTTFSPEYITKCTGPVAQQARYAISHLIESSGLGERRPVVTIKSGETVSLIKEELAERKTDLMVLGRSVQPDKAYRRRVTEALLKSSLCDILVIPAHGCS